MSQQANQAQHNQVKANVVMYATRFCPYCMRARRLLKQKQVEFEEISVSGDAALWEKMEQLSGRNTVPQIFINDEPIGGYDDMALLDSNGQLDQLLSQSENKSDNNS